MFLFRPRLITIENSEVGAAMHLRITGFLPGDDEDGSLKYSLNISRHHEQKVLDVLRWPSLATAIDGELKLTAQEVETISLAIGLELPLNLDLFISVRS